MLGRNYLWLVKYKARAGRDLRHHLLLLLKAKFSNSKHLLRATGAVCGGVGSRAGLPTPGPAHFLLPQEMARKPPPSALLDA